MKTPPSTLRGKLLEAKPRELTELEHRRARTKLLAAAAERARPRAPKQWALFGGVVAATAVLLLVNAHRRPLDIVAVVSTPLPVVTAAAPPPAVMPQPTATQEPPVSPPSPPVRAKTASPGPSFEKAFADFEKGNYGVADLELEGFLHAFPSDQRAEDAAYLRAVARFRLGDREGAAVLARTYLDDYPNGLRRPEAERMTH